MSDHYATLGVDRLASSETIDKAFKRAAMLYHPDRIGSTHADPKKFQAIEEARRVLLNREDRANYDRSLIASEPAPVLACVTRADFDAAKALAAWSDPPSCPFCDGAREVRVGGGGFWFTKPCPSCAREGVSGNV